ncbi:CHASE2 domain-containing protein [Acuticoccus kandeliae]|uniref:CHASE2 domain-containing protein n=1 Tax=Acuticoccus kandeliae TaxID=2073160 RepID=UPI001472E003|nr:adenylate/guanylate cyclase domain-containing protein [Acuticoccus kandeliae]
MRLRAPFWIAAGGALAALAWAAAVALPHMEARRGFADGLEATLVDLRLRLSGPQGAAGDVVVVGVDDETLAMEGAGYPLPRGRLGELVEQVGAAGAKAIALDVLLLDGGETAGDKALAAALGRVPTVIAAAARFDGAAGAVPRATTTLWPAPAFAEAARTGVVNVATAATGTPRHLPMLVLTDRGPQAHLALRAAAAYLGVEPEMGLGAVRLGVLSVPLDAGYYMPLRVHGPTATLPTVSARDVLTGAAGDRLAGKLAVIGFTASAVGDTFSTPYDPVTPGVEILAGGMLQLVGGPGLSRTDFLRRTDAAMAAALALGGAVAIALLPLGVGLTLAAGVLLVWAAVIVFLFGEGVWLNLAIPLVVCVPLFLVVGGARYLHERRVSRRAQSSVVALSRFHSPALAKRLSEDPAYLDVPKTETLAILFVDLASFTTLSESIGLEATQRMLKGFHSAVADVVSAHGGVTLNYLGDGALAAFGMPDPGMHDADNALKAAHALVAATRALPSPAPGAPPLDARVGVHLDPVVLSRLGHAEHQQLTVTGDGVNLAARLMEVAKGAGANIAASSHVMERLTGPADPWPDSVINVPIRGRKATIDVAIWAVKRKAPAAAPLEAGAAAS